MPYYDHFSAIEPTNRGLKYARAKSKRDLACIKMLIGKDLSNRPIVEIGPGRGTFAEECIRQGYRYIAIEPNEKLAAKLSLNGIHVIKQYTPPIPLESCSCSVVYASNVLEHMSDVSQAINLLDEMVRVIDRGGLIYIRVPDYLSWGKEFWNGDYTHNFVTTERRLRQMYTDIGLNIEKAVYFSGPFTGATSKITRLVARIVPYKLLSFLLKPVVLPERIYKAKIDYLGSFVLVGRKP